MFGRKRYKQKRESPVALWLSGDTGKNLLVPSGYKPVPKHEEVRKCIHKIADLISSMTIFLMQNNEDGDIRLKNGLAMKIDINPNQFMTRKNLIYKITSDMLIYGNSVIYPELKDGFLENLHIWNMEHVKFKDAEKGYLIEYNQKIFEPSELLHFALIPDDSFPYIGQGFIPIVRETILNICQANHTKTAFLQSNYRPSLVIRVESDAEGMQIKEEREKILNSYVGDTAAGEPWIVPASEVDIREIKSMSLQDLAVQDSIELDKKAIAAAFGVPSFMLGVGTFSKDEYNNFINSVIMPIAKSIEQEMSKKLVYKNEWYFKFNRKSLMMYDLSELTAHVKDMVAGGLINRNEGRNAFDYSPVEGLNDYIVLENYIPIDAVGDQKKLNNNEKGGDEVT